jgi:pimeloyl-ACP methyl ester carboxylesterase/DNA-binding beta-propeller fold protein YncE
MNRAELETVIRAIDPASGEGAPHDLRRRVMTETVEGAHRPARRRPAGPLLAVTVFGVIVAMVLVPSLLVDRTPTTPPASNIPGAVLDVPTGTVPGVRGAALDGKRLWVMSARDEILFEIPVDGGDVIEHEIGAYAEGVTVFGGAIWLGGYNPDQIIRVVPDGGLFGRDAITRIPLPGPPEGGAVVGNEFWVGAGGSLVRIGADGDVLDMTDNPVGALAVEFGAVWGSETSGAVVTLDPASGEVINRFELGLDPTRVVASSRALWVNDRTTNSVVAILPTSGQVITRVDVGGPPHSMVLVGDRLWVSVFDTGTLVEIDPSTGEILRRVAMGGGPGLFAAGDLLGVSFHRSARVALIDPRRPLVELPPGPVTDQLVELDSGRAVRVRCLGAGTPTVVLEAEFGEGVNSWSTVQAMLGSRQRVCATERSGVWGAEGFPPASSADEAVSDLRLALTMAGEAGPYLLVGQGVGGWVSRAFAATHPSEVVGMVLVDPQPDDFLERFAQVAPEEWVRGLATALTDPSENTRLRTTAANPGRVPVLILGHDPQHSPWYEAFDRFEEADAIWQDGLASMAELLGAKLTTVANAGRFIQYDDPGAVVGAVTALVPTAGAVPTTPAVSCSATGLDPTVVPQGLPGPVAATRQAIVEAATDCDFARLAELGGDLRYSFGGGNDPAGFWREIEAAGPEPLPLESMVELLALPFGTIEAGDITYYVWPRAFSYDSWGSVPDEDRRALTVLYDASDQEGFAQFGAYIGYRVGITSDGTWAYFVDGD